jgi:preprotein translocase subunit SecE
MTLDNQRVLQYALYGLGLVVWYILWKLMGSVTDVILVFGHYPQIDVPLIGSITGLYAIVALVITGAGVEYTRRHPVANKFGIEVVGELRKVTWPNWTDVKGTTLVVLAVSFVVAFILFAFDSFYNVVITKLFSLAS